MALASIRPPAVAGQFYPGDERVLRTQLAEMLSTAVALEAAPMPKAIIVPHAGYMYSGPVAASAYALLAPLRERADVLIDTRAMTPHDLRAELTRQFGEDEPLNGLAITLHSFSYKRGLPRGADMVIDVRFLRNPHWVADLRPRDGRDPAVAGFVEADPDFAGFQARLEDLLAFLLPAYRAEGKSYFSIGIGCTGGRHRSVAVVEALAKTLAAKGWQVSIRHRELERTTGDAAPVPGMGVA